MEHRVWFSLDVTLRLTIDPTICTLLSSHAINELVGQTNALKASDHGLLIRVLIKVYIFFNSIKQNLIINN